MGMMGIWSSVMAQLAPAGARTPKRDRRLNVGEEEVDLIPGIENHKKYARIVADEQGFWRIEDILVATDIGDGELSEDKYPDLRDKMNAYFSSKSEIFDLTTSAATPTEPHASESGASSEQPKISEGAQADRPTPSPPQETFENFAPLFWEKEHVTKTLTASLAYSNTILTCGLIGIVLCAFAIHAPVLPVVILTAASIVGVVIAFAQWRTFHRVHHKVLKDGYLNSGVWPGFLESRLIEEIRRKFPDVDDDMRVLADLLANIFLHNLKQLVVLKRRYQRNASNEAITYSWKTTFGTSAAAISAATIGILVFRHMAVDTHDLATEAACAVAFVLSFFAVGVALWRRWHNVENKVAAEVGKSSIGGNRSGGMPGTHAANKNEASARDFFERYNKETTDAHYVHSLTRTCDKISTAFQLRLKSIDGAIGDVEKQQGKFLIAGHDNGTNPALKILREKEGFFLTQLILWLSKRSEYQQLYIKDRMQQMQRHYFFVDIDGYQQAHKIATGLSRTVNRVAVLQLLVNIISAGFSCGIAALIFSPSGMDGKLVSIVPIVALATLPAVGFAFYSWWANQEFVHMLAERSYTNEAWNPRFGILKDALKTDDWKTFDKIRVDEKLARQFQEALGAIYIARQANKTTP